MRDRFSKMDKMMHFPDIFHLFWVLFLLLIVFVTNSLQAQESSNNQYFKIDGKVVIPTDSMDPNWVSTTRVLVDGGEHLGFLRGDGSFTVNNIPKGSYVIEVIHSSFIFEPARVDVTSTGKIRARRVNNIQTGHVSTVQYPLKFKPRGNARYFQVREQWRITDFLFNHMVLMMVFPFLVIVLLPKLVSSNDPETQREMQNHMNMLNPRQQMPEFSEMITSWFGGGSTKKSSGTVSKAKAKRQR